MIIYSYSKSTNHIFLFCQPLMILLILKRDSPKQQAINKQPKILILIFWQTNDESRFMLAITIYLFFNQSDIYQLNNLSNQIIQDLVPRMQETKHAPITKSVKTTLGSPSNKIRNVGSPKNAVNTNKSPNNFASTTSSKIGQWKTQKKIAQLEIQNMNEELKNSTSLASSGKNIMNKNEGKIHENIISPKNGKKQFVEPKGKVISPRNTFKGSTISQRSKIQLKEEKSAVIQACTICMSKDQQIKNFEQNIQALKSKLSQSQEQIVTLQKQKKQLEKNISKYADVVADYRKSIKQKAARFNNEGGEIKKVNQKIEQLEGIIEKLKDQKQKIQKNYGQIQAQLLQIKSQKNQEVLSNNVQFHQFPNLLQVQSQLISLGDPPEKLMTKGIKIQENKKSSSNSHNLESMSQSDIYQMLESRTQSQAQSCPNNIIEETRKIKQQYDISLQQIQTAFNAKYINLEQQLTSKQQEVDKISQRVNELQKDKQQSQKTKIELQKHIQSLQKQNQKLKSDYEKLQDSIKYPYNQQRQQKTVNKVFQQNLFKKISANTSMTNITTQKQFELSNDSAFHELQGNKNQKGNNMNRSMIITKLDRIKRISERQNEIILQIKQSSKMSSMCSDYSFDNSFTNGSIL